MRNARGYFDYNASAPLRPEARAAMMAALELTGNASSVHAEGRRLRAVVEDARQRVAVLLGARPAEVVFTSGATEANNWVLRAGWDTVIVSEIEHESVLAPASVGAGRLHMAGTGTSGRVDVGQIADMVLCEASDPGRGLISLQLANNETGVVQPVGEVAAFARAHGLQMHSDATQAVGRLLVDFAALGVDYLAMSGHKIGAPKGVGALVVREGADLPALLRGGGQERRQRAGTENVAAIAGLGAAAEAAMDALANSSGIARLRDRLEAGVCEITPGAVIVGAGSERICNTSCIALPGTPANILLIKLDLAGFAVGAGSACSSGKIGGSHVMQAMGLGREIGEAAIRVSIGIDTTGEDVGRFLAAWADITASTKGGRAAGSMAARPEWIRAGVTD